MSVLTVDSINRYFFAKISDKTIHDARKIGIAKLIADNTTVEELCIQNVPDSKKIDLIFEGLKHNITLKYLNINGFGYGRVPFPNCGVKHLVINRPWLPNCSKILSECTTLNTLTINNLHFYDDSDNDSYEIVEFGKFIRNFKVKGLYINTDSTNVPPQICENIFKNENIQLLSITAQLLKLSNYDTIAKILSNNTKLETLSISSSNLNYFVDGSMFLESLKSNKSIINFKINQDDGVSPPIRNILMRNKCYRWHIIHRILVDVVIAMFPLRINNDSLPPYVMLEIYDWIYEDNPYSTHFKKITLIMGLYDSIRKIPRYAIN